MSLIVKHHSFLFLPYRLKKGTMFHKMIKCQIYWHNLCQVIIINLQTSKWKESKFNWSKHEVFDLGQEYNFDHIEDQTFIMEEVAFVFCQTDRTKIFVLSINRFFTHDTKLNEKGI